MATKKERRIIAGLAEALQARAVQGKKKTRSKKKRKGFDDVIVICNDTMKMVEMDDFPAAIGGLATAAAYLGEQIGGLPVYTAIFFGLRDVTAPR